jgi:hypothetical protein
MKHPVQAIQRVKPSGKTGRRGRPPKEKSDATLTRRLQILMSPEDIERIIAIMDLTTAGSMGEVIREAVRREFERLETKRRGQKIK